jgi:Putative Actinobacterial Holin-X, holin superfamily III
MNDPHHPRSASDLFSAALSQVSHLARIEFQLARSEIAAKATEAGVAVGYLAAAAVLTIPGIVLLLMALSAFLVEIGMGVVAADLGAGAFGLLISALVGLIGFSKFKHEALFPDRTVNQLQRDSTAIKEHF